MQAISITK